MLKFIIVYWVYVYLFVVGDVLVRLFDCVEFVFELLGVGV